MNYWHRRDALAWDMEGGWDGRVVMVAGSFMRYVDRNGDTVEPVGVCERCRQYHAGEIECEGIPR